jgi:hypothetical protein
MKTKGGSSDKDKKKALDNLKYIIFLLLHLDNNNYNKTIEIEEQVIDNVNQKKITPGRPKDKIIKLIETEFGYNEYNEYAGQLQNEINEDETRMRNKKNLKTINFLELIKNRLDNTEQLSNHYFTDDSETKEILEKLISISKQIKNNQSELDLNHNIKWTIINKNKKPEKMNFQNIQNNANDSDLIYKLKDTLENFLYLKKVLSDQYENFGKNFFRTIENDSYFDEIEEILKKLYDTNNIDKITTKISSQSQKTKTTFADKSFGDLNELFKLNAAPLPPPPPPPLPPPGASTVAPPPPPLLPGFIDGKASFAPKLQEQIELEKQQQQESEKKEALENGIALKGYTLPSSKGPGYAKNSKGNLLWNTAFISNPNLPYNTVDTVDVYLYNLFKQISDETTGHMKQQSNQAEKSIDNIGSVFEFKSEGATKSTKNGGKKTKGKKTYKNKTRRKYKK